jgi:hypothetical protein
MAARGLRTTYDEVEDGEYSLNPTSIAVMMRNKRIEAMRSKDERDFDALQARRDRLNEMHRADEMRLLQVYGQNDEIPDGPLVAGGVWDSIKSGAKKVGSAIKKGGSAVKKGAKKVGGAAKKVYGKAKEVGGKIKEKVSPGLGKAWEATKSGAAWVGEKAQAGGSWLKDKLFAPKGEKQRLKKDQMYVDQLAADNLADQMSIDELYAEQERLDRSNRALAADWATRQKHVDYRWDNLERKKRFSAMEQKRARLEEEMYR